MRIIYDSDKPSEDRVQIEGYFDKGKFEMPISCFDIRVEFTFDGKPHSEMHVSRWGNAAKRKETHKALTEDRRKKAANNG